VISFQNLSMDDFYQIEKEIFQLDKACFSDCIWDPDQWSTLFKHYHLKVIIVQKEEKYIGFIAFSNIENESEIFKIGVKPSVRNLSIGQQLIEKMINLLKKNNAEIVFLEVRSDNQSAIKLYSKCFFKLISRRKNYYQNPVCDALIYQLKV
jgi:[ribosomal protein S18]-alanine N-acetyltransferase